MLSALLMDPFSFRTPDSCNGDNHTLPSHTITCKMYQAYLAGTQICTQHTTLVVYRCSNHPQFTQHTLHVCTACSAGATGWPLTAVSVVSVGTEAHVANHQEIREGSPQLLYGQDGRALRDICCRAPCILEGRLQSGSHQWHHHHVCTVHFCYAQEGHYIEVQNQITSRQLQNYFYCT